MEMLLQSFACTPLHFAVPQHVINVPIDPRTDAGKRGRAVKKGGDLQNVQRSGQTLAPLRIGSAFRHLARRDDDRQ